MAKPSERRKPEPPKGGQEEQPRAAGGAPVPYRRGDMAPYGGLGPFHHLREEFDRLFDQFLPRWASPWEGADRGGHWGLDVQEDEGAVVVRAEAPGFEPPDFDLQVRDNQLILRAAHKAEAEGKE